MQADRHPRGSLHAAPSASATDRPAEVWPLTPATSVHEARAHLRATGERAGVVYRSDRPVGVVTAAALASTHDANAPVVTVMDHATVPVTLRADARETVCTFIRAARSWLRHRPRA